MERIRKGKDVFYLLKEVVLQCPEGNSLKVVVNDGVTKPDKEIVFINGIQRSPESNSCKLVENGRVNILVIRRLSLGKISKSLAAKNNRKELLVGYLLKLSSNQHPGKLGGNVLHFKIKLPVRNNLQVQSALFIKVP